MVKLVLSLFFSRIGTLAGYIGTIFLTTKLTDSSVSLSIIILCQSLPIFIVGSFGGWVIDRYSIKKILIISDILRAIILIALFFLAKYNLIKMWHLYTGTIFISILTALYKPSIESIITSIVEVDKRRAINAFNELFYYIAGVIGPPVGSILITKFDYSYNFMFDGVSYIFALILMLSLTKKLILKSTNIEPSKTNVVELLKNNYTYITNNRANLVLLIFMTYMTFILRPMSLIIPVVCEEIFNDAKLFGYILTFFSAGGILGAISAKYIRESSKPTNYIIIYSILISFILAILSFLTQIQQFTLILFIYAFSKALMDVHYKTLLQNHSKEEIKGFIFSVSNSIINAAGPLGILVTGIVINHIYILNIFKYMSILIVFFMLLSIIVLKLRLNSNS
ncbi:MFS transporter [Caloranaerobacter sp. DY30410]|uniref:MFS transporter n=1 Tax=Caloranaerobacter sp. DY30410 TaxID=3238305 RepID=UPI003CFCD69B